MEKTELKATKHWSAYFIAGFIIFQGIVALLAPNLPFMIGGAVIAFGIFIIFAYQRAIWVYDGENLTMKGGILPWKRFHLDVPIEDIYEAWTRKGFIGTILGYKAIHIRRTDGSTSGFSMNQMRNTTELMQQLNSDVRKRKKQVAEPVAPTIINQATTSTTDELLKLNELKEKGIITNEEFTEQKTKILNG